MIEFFDDRDVFSGKFKVFGDFDADKTAADYDDIAYRVLRNVIVDLFMEALVHSVRARGASMLIITHDPRTAAYADREVTVRDGRITLDTTPGGPR